MIPTPIEQELERRACERMARLYEMLGSMSHLMSEGEDFGDYVRTIYIDLSKNVGFPKLVPIPEPKFQNADDMVNAKPLPLDAYDREALKWSRCPTCDSKDINWMSKTGKPYTACFDCHIFLQTDGKTNPMKDVKK